MSLIVAVLVATDEILYLTVVSGQGSSDQPWRVPFLVGFIAALAVCAGTAAVLRSNRWQATLLGASAAGLLVLGFFAIFSIGLPLLIAGVIAIIGVARLVRLSAQSGRLLASAVAGGAIALTLLFAGFAVTERIIACPPGAVSGGGSGMFTSYSYTCRNGHATVTYR